MEIFQVDQLVIIAQLGKVKSPHYFASKLSVTWSLRVLILTEPEDVILSFGVVVVSGLRAHARVNRTCSVHPPSCLYSLTLSTLQGSVNEEVTFPIYQVNVWLARNWERVVLSKSVHAISDLFRRLLYAYTDWLGGFSFPVLIVIGTLVNNFAFYVKHNRLIVIKISLVQPIKLL